jgi:phage tail sheath protein FI
MIFLKKQITIISNGILFDPNEQITWNRFLNQVNPFLSSVQSRFGLSDYRVILDSSTTTPDMVDRNIMYAKILLKPTRAIEFIALDFVITRSGVEFE